MDLLDAMVQNYAWGDRDFIADLQRRGIELQMPPAVIGHYGSAGGRVELGVDGMQAS